MDIKGKTIVYIAVLCLLLSIWTSNSLSFSESLGMTGGLLCVTAFIIGIINDQ